MSKAKPDLNGKTLALGILSWHGHASLRQALTSYKQANFFSLFDDVMAFLPDPTPKVIAVCEEFSVRYETQTENKGILDGMEQITQRLSTDYIFFTENDCPLIEPRAEAKRQIEKAIALLADDRAIMARMRHTKEFGETFDTIDKYRRYHPDTASFMSGMRRLLRPGKAKRLSGTSIYAGPGHPERFPKQIENVGDGFYLVDASIMPWTNQSVILAREVMRDRILPYCKSVPFGRNINGFRSIEIELNNSDFWVKSGWKIACGPGLLTHKRAQDRGY